MYIVSLVVRYHQHYYVSASDQELFDGRQGTQQACVDSWPWQGEDGCAGCPLHCRRSQEAAAALPAYSTPGPDGTTYAHWKRLDPEGKLLTTVMNICREAARVPPSWKTSTTVLAYKNKGDEKDLKNWRPICLQNMIYKIYAATIAKRIASWAIDGDVINTTQKGFLPYEGCFEHTFLLRSCLEDACRRKRKPGWTWRTRLVWYPPNTCWGPWRS